MKIIKQTADQIIFNTGAEYTPEGQIITATLLSTRPFGSRNQFSMDTVHFHDESRGISGICQVMQFNANVIYQHYLDDDFKEAHWHDATHYMNEAI